MFFSVMSRQEARRYSFHPKKVPTIIISITDPDTPPNQFAPSEYILNVLHLQFEDIEGGEGSMTEQDAQKVAVFVNKYKDIAEYIIVHCEAGISRSAGVCAAIMKYLTWDDSYVFNNPRFCPNRHCYRLTLNALDASECNEQTIDDKFKKNTELWCKANDIEYKE